jgi:3-hydroxyisobutyrate dehydrogenase-like beta-hydroxyacid dehydrogenase
VPGKLNTDGGQELALVKHLHSSQFNTGIIRGENVQPKVDTLRWGIIGFGEAGSAFAGHIGQRSMQPIQIVDPLLNRPPLPNHLRERLDSAAAEVVPDITTLVRGCDIVLSLVTPRLAAPIAQEAASARSRGLYIDFNSVAPNGKREMAALFPDNAYVDGAILGSIAGEGAATPLALGGPRAAEAHTSLSGVELIASVVGDEVGAASALKMCRSVFMKGLECLFVETLLAADQFDIKEPVLSSIEETVAAYGLRPMAKMLVTTHAAHCGRRAEEMDGVTRMLEETGMRSEMSQATRDFLDASSQSGITDHFKHRVPDQIEDVIAYFRNSKGAKEQ